MRDVYVYEDVSGFSIELYNRELTEEECTRGADTSIGECRKFLQMVESVEELQSVIDYYGGIAKNNEEYFISIFKEIRDGKIDSSEIE